MVSVVAPVSSRATWGKDGHMEVGGITHAVPAHRDPVPVDIRDAAVATLVGRLVGEYLGDEPRTRTYLNGDVITVVLEDTLTKGEERLVRDGMSELVLGMRSAFQKTMREDLITRVEELTGRKVRATANDMRSDISVEVLVLDGASRDGQRDATVSRHGEALPSRT
jgi:uncharacterized protein YbcI